ncbi:MAG TPA: hypothetical protein VF659_01750 [Pyrinomonadaceae bacterium]|jgi:hypothetical protein
MKSYEPAEMTPGETLEWSKALADYSPAEGWALTYYFRNASGTGFNAAATPGVNSWEVSVVVPTNVGPGRIDWEAWVKKGDEEQLAGAGTATVRPSLKATAADAQVDSRSQAEKDLDAVRAALVPATSAGVMEYEIGGVGTNRRIRYFGKEELLALETRLAQRVNAERRAAARKRGAPYFKTIYPR